MATNSKLFILKMTSESPSKKKLTSQRENITTWGRVKTEIMK